MKKFWDHSASPSQWVIKKNEVEIFRGTFNDGLIFLRSLDNGGMISFENDYIDTGVLRCEGGASIAKKVLR